MAMTETRPYSTANTPAAIATHNQLAASISKSPKRTHYQIRVVWPGRSRAAENLYHTGMRAGTTRSDFEVGLELASYRGALDRHIVRQPVLVGWIGFPGNQRREVAAAGGRDPESVGRNVVARHLLFPVRHFRQRHMADDP